MKKPKQTNKTMLEENCMQVAFVFLQDFLGRIEISLGEVVAAPSGRVDLPLT